MSKIELKKEQKRGDILRAAQTVFRADGYIGAGMDKIAQQAGVTKQTVYRYFSAKDVLFRACLEAQRAADSSHFLRELDREDTREALTCFALGFLGVHMSGAHLAGMRLLLAEGPSAPEMTRAFFAVGPEKTETRLVEFLRARLRSDDPEYAAKALLSTLLSMRMHVLIGLCEVPTQEELAAHAARSVALFLHLAA